MHCKVWEQFVFGLVGKRMIPLSLLFPALQRKLKRREINRRYWQRLRNDPERCARVLKERYIPWSRSRHRQAPRVYPATDHTVSSREHLGQDINTMMLAESARDHQAAQNIGTALMERGQPQTSHWPENI